MHPILIDLGSWNLPLFGPTHLFLPSYGVLFASAVLIAWFWFSHRARELHLSEDRLFNLTFYSLLAGILGAKLLLIVVGWRTYLAHPEEILSTLRSAGVLMGGIVVGGLTFIIYARRYGMPLWTLGDAIAAPLAFAQGIGRLGCFAAGCCWGVPTHPDHALAVVFTSDQAHAQTGVPLGTPLIATQLLEMSFDLLLALGLTWMWRVRPRPAGTVFWTYVLLYSLARATIEFWRGDSHRGLFFGETVSTSQLLALGGAAIAAIVLLRGRLRRDRGDAAAV